jgi:hypothetical protein
MNTGKDAFACEDCNDTGTREVTIEGGEDSLERDVEVFCDCEKGSLREIASLGFDPRQRFAKPKIQEIP